MNKKSYPIGTRTYRPRNCRGEHSGRAHADEGGTDPNHDLVRFAEPQKQSKCEQTHRMFREHHTSWRRMHRPECGEHSRHCKRRPEQRGQIGRLRFGELEFAFDGERGQHLAEAGLESDVNHQIEGEAHEKRVTFDGRDAFFGVARLLRRLRVARIDAIEDKH